MGLIDKIKDWYASREEIMKDRKITRRYDKLNNRLYILCEIADGHTVGFRERLDIYIFPKKYSSSKIVAELQSLGELYCAALNRISARLEKSLGYKVSEKTA